MGIQSLTLYFLAYPMRFIALILLALCVSTSLQGMTPAQKDFVAGALTKGLALLQSCAVDYITSKVPAPIMAGVSKLSGLPIKGAITWAVGKLLGVPMRRRMWGFPNIVGALKGAASNLAKGAAAIGGAVQGAASQVNKLTGVALSKMLAGPGCEALTKAGEAAFAAETGIIGLPSCITSWFKSECGKAVTSALKRARLVRRLSSIRRELMAF